MHIFDRSFKIIKINKINNFPVIIDLSNNPEAPTGDFELIYECMIERTGPPSQKIQLNVDGKKILPPVRNPRQFFPFRNITELVIQGEKLFNPLKGEINH